jgi:GNAT superfamily N-acetyltransferase
MSNTYTITSEETPSPSDLTAVRDGLEAFNQAHAEAVNYRPRNLFVRDAEGKVAGGLIGATYWGWLYVEILWVAEGTRGRGYGSRLLEQAEREALGRGCHGAHLDTMDFQALPFYQRHEYRVYGVLEDLPRGHARYFLKKALDDSSSRKIAASSASPGGRAP